MLNAFGWDREQRNMQQDASEFQLKLIEKLEEVMKGTS